MVQLVCVIYFLGIASSETKFKKIKIIKKRAKEHFVVHIVVQCLKKSRSMLKNVD